MGARAKSTYCDLSSFGPALFEIWWPNIYLGGPYGPVKDKMYWPGGVKSAPGQCLCRRLLPVHPENHFQCGRYCYVLPYVDRPYVCSGVHML